MNNSSIPSPRLEFLWEKQDDGRFTCRYSLVIPLRDYDIRREDENGDYFRSEISIPISTTMVDTNNPLFPIQRDGIIDTPYRDTTHARWDKEALGGNLKIIVRYKDQWNIVE